MIVSELIQLSYQEALGESEAPAVDDESYKLLFNAGNGYIDLWQDEKGVEWESLTDRDTITVTAASEFNLDTSIVRRLAKNTLEGVIVTALDGSEAEFTIVKPSQLPRHGRFVTMVGNKLRFAEPFAADSPFIDGTISYPFIKWATKLTGPDSIIPVDRPMWLVYMCAWFLAGQDYVKSNQAPRLAGMAKAEMDSMKAENSAEEDEYVTHGPTPIVTRTTR